MTINLSDKVTYEVHRTCRSSLVECDCISTKVLTTKVCLRVSIMSTSELE